MFHDRYPAHARPQRALHVRDGRVRLWVRLLHISYHCLIEGSVSSILET